MAGPVTLALLSVLAVSLLSLIGAISLMWRAIYKHGVLMVLVALAAGTLLGGAFLHLLPEAVEAEHGFTAAVGATFLAGFVLMFVMEIGLRWRHAHVEAADVGEHAHAHGHFEPSGDLAAVKPFGWMNLVSDGVHNLLDGAVIAAAFLVDTTLGFVATIAVAAHEIPQELGDFAVLVRAGMRPAQALLLNLASALVALVGAGIVLAAGIPPEALQVWALPLIAGAFVYIAAADLIPELHHHTKGREGFLIFLGLLAGILLMWLVGGLEGLLAGGDGHAHG